MQKRFRVIWQDKWSHSKPEFEDFEHAHFATAKFDSLCKTPKSTSFAAYSIYDKDYDKWSTVRIWTGYK